ncbi:MAG: hypothetical protein JST40_12205 [Armatimonadetes bacterium]|nr:hypothetical protein [Armatimonadota bacterium]
MLANAAFLATVILWAKYDNELHGYGQLPIGNAFAILAAYVIGYLQANHKPHASKPQMKLAWYSVPLITLVALTGGYFIEVYRGLVSIRTVGYHTLIGFIIALVLALQVTIAYKINPDKRSLAERLGDPS